ncbi:glycosyltransferase family 2 protein [Candidatus Margulisiibacteriota bacterium]
MPPTVSVIMAAHNHAHFLQRSIGSVLEQTYLDYELIVIDNGSTDNTAETVRKLETDRVRYIYQDDTGSVAGPRNTGIKAAKGKYVAFLDSDDHWYPEKLQRVMRCLKHNPNIDVICHDMLRSTSEKVLNKIIVGPDKEGDIFTRLLYEGNFLLGSGVTVKREAIVEVGNFDERQDFVNAEDYETWLRLARAGNQFFFLNEVLGELHIHSSNLSGDIKRSTNNLRNVIKHHILESFNKPSLSQKIVFRKALAQTYYFEARNWQQRGSYLPTCWYYLRSIVMYPVVFKPYLFLLVALLRLEKVLERLKIYTIRA